MDKILLIIKREYLTRVKKKSFLVMTILGPILMAAVFIVPVYFAQMEGEVKKLGIIDETGLFANEFENTDNLNFNFLNSDIETAKSTMKRDGLLCFAAYSPR